ncbi:hypothetical protein PI124_g20102 [Phytophthora idaei]|nr:hypothetical protein PI125_g21183 [Phytophthora idaei]KAG3132806.1 hypothetical protein PI126_g19471 [Phytophthora idaei]KAG3234852.1 hypothetical protein PI124_g20102 [Phytophthora idaei]
MNFSVTKSVIEDIKADAKLILSNRKGSEGKPDVRALAKKHGCSRTTIRHVGKSTGKRKRKRCLDVVARALQQLPAGISDRDQARRLGIPFTLFRDVKARIAATTNQAVQSSTEAVFSATDVVITTDAEVPSADAAVGTTDVVRGAIHGELRRNARVPGAVHEERGQARLRVYRVVQRKFSQWQERAPTRERRRVAPENVFENSVNAFSLSIRLRMCCCRHQESGAQQIEEAGPEC